MSKLTKQEIIDQLPHLPLCDVVDIAKEANKLGSKRKKEIVRVQEITRKQMQKEHVSEPELLSLLTQMTKR
ncbi:hypothetical protein [Vibrio vulnificus]|uniref:hypothetical protein n=1 Tax=Vibrio vulnificus TaxID=672 RepID=UPI001023D9B7|nr:hypothetical protein [Vibrio vulnificus]EHZ2651947.1 hypothetical protein [Vibrio vulnificus]RZQ33195.1 hypothetical protein D8T38_18300 [Vibrio vulnificus]